MEFIDEDDQPPPDLSLSLKECPVLRANFNSSADRGVVKSGV
jgi:hypothetical protein